MYILDRPLSSMSSQGRRSKQKYHHFNTADSFDANNGSQLQVKMLFQGYLYCESYYK